MNIGWTTGYTENYWGNWPWTKMYGGSEAIVVEVSKALAAQGHSVTVRLPYKTDERVWQGVRWLGVDAPEQRYDICLCADDFHRRDRGVRNVLVACRSDPPPHADFDELIFLSRHHSELMGHAGRPFVGGGVNLQDYAQDRPRLPRRVICTSSPDRCPKATQILRPFDGLQTYRPVRGVGREYSRPELIEIQQTAQVLIHPCDPRRPAEFFCMAVLEGMAAGTPCLISDADALPELWGDAVAKVLYRPITYADWAESIEGLLASPRRWQKYQRLGRLRAKEFDWPIVAQKYLAATN